MNDLAEGIAVVLAEHERSGVSSVNEGRGDDERCVGYHAWCYCGDAEVNEGAAGWRGAFKVPADQAGAELRAHVAAAVAAHVAAKEGEA